MASVNYRKHRGKWYIRFRTTGRKEQTKIYPESLSETEIKRKVAWYQEEIARDNFDPWSRSDQVEGIHLDYAIKLFISDGLRSRRWKTDVDGHSNTADSYRRRLKRLQEKFGNISVEYLDTEDIGRWIAGRKKLDKTGRKTNQIISPVTASRHVTSYNTFFKWLHKNRYTQELKVIYLPPQTKQQARQIMRQPKGISYSQLETFCKAAKERVAQTEAQPRYAKKGTVAWVVPCAKLTFWLMLRRKEIINIYPEDISADYQYFTYGSQGSKHRPRFIPKSGIDTLPILQPAQKVFKQINIHDLPKDQPIFDYSYDYIGVAFRRISMRALGENYSPHTFRHGGIIHLRSVLTQPGLISRMARHASQDVTDTHYGGVDPVYLKRAINEEGL